MPSLIDLTGKKFNRLSVIEREYKNVRGGREGGKRIRTTWKCRCDCGKITYVESFNLNTGKTKSCGCYYIENRRYCSFKNDQIKHPLYRIWAGIKSRCYKVKCPTFKYYGARNILMYKPWKNDFRIFADYIEEFLGNRPSKNHSVDRIDTNKGYLPDNIRWATALEQTRNRRKVNPEKYSSKFKGVSKLTYNNRFVALIRVNGKTMVLGRFDTQEEAALAYNKAAKKYFGEFAHLNKI